MRKGLSPIISAILILLIAISVTLLAIIWLPRLTLKIFPLLGFNESYIRSRGCLSIENVDGLFGFFTIKNCGKVALSDFRFFIDSSFINKLNIGTLEPSQSIDFYDMPLTGGEHDLYITADNAESQYYHVKVPYWECIGGEPILVEDWYVSKNISCICSYNTIIPAMDVHVIGNGSLSLYNCILQIQDMRIEDNGFFNFTKSTLISPSDGDIEFLDDSESYIKNSLFDDVLSWFEYASNVTVINSHIHDLYINSNIHHKLPISNFNAIVSPITGYIKADDSNFTLNLTNVSFDYSVLQISDSSNNTLRNSKFYGFYVSSDQNQNLTINNWRGYTTQNLYFKAQDSDFTFDAQSFYGGWTTFYGIGNSNNTVTNSRIGSVEAYGRPNNTLINCSIDYVYLDENSVNVFKNCNINNGFNFGFSWIGVSNFAKVNFSNTTLSNSISFDTSANPSRTMNTTFFGNVTFLNAYVNNFVANVTRNLPTIIKDTGNSVIPTMQRANISLTDKFNNSVWQGSVSGGSLGTYYFENPIIVFNKTNYGPGNFTMKVSQICENKTDINFLNSTPIEFTINRSYNYDGTSFSTQGNRGLSFDNSNFWTAAAGGSVYKYNKTGGYVSSFNSGLNGLRDVSSNGTYLWLLNYNSTEKRVYRYRTSDYGYDNWNFDISAVLEPYAVDFDGESFWVLGNTSVYKYNITGGYTGFSFNLNRLPGMYYGDIVSSSGNIWILTENYSSSNGRGVFRYKNNGTYDNWYFEIAPTTTTGRGLAFNGTYFWVMNSTGSVFRYGFNRNCLDFMKNCDEFITFLPYIISKNNTRYCMLYSLYLPSQAAITFANNVKNSTLDCQWYNIGGNGVANTIGIYLTGANNNTISNCNINSFDNGIKILSSSNNTITNTNSNSNGAGIVVTSSSNNAVTNCSINSNINNDYYLASLGINNNFTSTNFTDYRTIYFYDSSSWFNYKNETTGNIWLKTSVSAQGQLKRKLINWNNTLMQWNDTSNNAITARYNVTGLVPGAPYSVYDNLVELINSPIKADSSGTLSLMLNLPQNEEHEIRVKAICDYYIYSAGYTISQNNNVYCLVSNIINSGSTRAIQFSSGVQNSTLDCLNNLIDGLRNDNRYGIYASKNYNITIRNCNLTDWGTSIYYSNSSKGLIKNINAYYVGYDKYFININSNSSNNLLTNITLNYAIVGDERHGIIIDSSDNNKLTNITSNVSQLALYIFDTSFNDEISDSVLLGIESIPVDVWPPIWESTNYCDHKFTNVVGKNNKPILYYGNTPATIKNWYNNFSEIILCNADNSVIDNVTMIDNYGIKAWASSNSTFTNMNIYNFSYHVSPLSFRFDGGNMLANITVDNTTEDAISIGECDNNQLKNITVKNSLGCGILIGYNADYNNVNDGSIFNNKYDYCFGEIWKSPSVYYSNNVTNTNFTDSRKIYFLSEKSSFIYSNDSALNIWIKTKVSQPTVMTRKLLNWNQTLMKWNDSFDVAISTKYDVSGLVPNTCYNVYNNSVLTYNLYSDSNGQISFTINLPANQQINITVNNVSCNVLNLNFNEANGTVAHDLSVYGNDGTYYGETFNHGTSYSGSTLTDLHTSSGYFGKALSFDGSNDYIQVQNSNELNPNYITVSAWIFPNTDKLLVQSSGMIVKKISWANNQGYFMEWRNDTKSVAFYIGNGTNWKYIVSSSNSVPLNEWTYVTGTYDGSYVRVYINDALNVSASNSGTIASSTDNLRIGAESISYKRFNGTIDEVRIWNRNLSQAEIQAEMSSSIPVTRPVAAWSFEESGNYVNDTHIWVNGTYGLALSFDGNDDIVNAGNPTSLQTTGDMTIMFWAYPTNIGAKRQNPIDKAYCGEFALTQETDGSLSFYQGPNGGEKEGYMSRGWDSVFVNNQWVHVALVRNISEPLQDSRIRLYKNGYDQGGGGSSWVLPSVSSEPVTIGNGYIGGYIGKIDEVRIWNRALSQSDIQSEMNRG